MGGKIFSTHLHSPGYDDTVLDSKLAHEGCVRLGMPSLTVKEIPLVPRAVNHFHRQIMIKTTDLNIRRMQEADRRQEDRDREGELRHRQCKIARETE